MSLLYEKIYYFTRMPPKNDKGRLDIFSCMNDSDLRKEAERYDYYYDKRMELMQKNYDLTPCLFNINPEREYIERYVYNNFILPYLKEKTFFENKKISMIKFDEVNIFFVIIKQINKYDLFFYEYYKLFFINYYNINMIKETTIYLKDDYIEKIKNFNILSCCLSDLKNKKIILHPYFKKYIVEEDVEISY